MRLAGALHHLLFVREKHVNAQLYTEYFLGHVIRVVFFFNYYYFYSIFTRNE